LRIRTRTYFLAAVVALCGFPALGQSWEVGGTIGIVDDVSHRLALDQFRSKDVSGWVGYELEPQVQLRGTFGSFRTTGANSERSVTDASGATVTAPRLTTHVDYATIGVSYEFFQGDSTSGVFAGIGGYKLRPDAAPAGFEAFEDPSATELGWHFGVDGSFRIVSHLSAVGRLTLHGFHADVNRSILTAAAGLSWRF
jgi:hypothetical protein